LAKEDQIKEDIRFKTEVLKLWTVVFIADSGGIVSLLVNSANTAVRNFFVAVGILIFAICIVTIISDSKRIKKLIEKL